MSAKIYMISSLKNLAIFFALTQYGACAFADFTQSQNEFNSNKVPIFGMTLGVSTLEEISKMVPMKSERRWDQNGVLKTYSEPDIEINYYGKIISDGKTTNGAQIPEVKYADFELDSQYFAAKFINDVLFELIVKYQKSDQEYDDGRLINNIKSNFNIKYKKSKSYSRTEKDNFFIQNYTYRTWIEPSNSFIVEIQERKKTVLNQRACLQANKFTGVGAAKIEYECLKDTDNIIRYTISYKDPVLNSKAYSLVLIEQEKISKENSLVGKELINKF